MNNFIINNNFIILICRPLRNVDTGQPMIIAEKTIDLFVKTQPKFKRQLNSTALSVTNRDSKFEERNMSPESWLKKFYRKSIIPRKTKSISDKIEENQNNTVSDTVFPERIALVKDETETNDTRKGVINQPEPLVIDQVVNSDDYDNFEEEDDEGIYDYEYVIFINKQKDENEDVEILDELDDTPPPPDSDFNTINMYNNLYKLASFNPDSSPVVRSDMIMGVFGIFMLLILFNIKVDWDRVETKYQLMTKLGFVSYFLSLQHTFFYFNGKIS